ncbi:MAG: oligosaccharide flippase family protein [Armatimonadetes bacterium]|nr:oligosaccharide flippase family protein [Armatimonadota bacterium]CUU37489.1 polysaccharide transporter, PST family [Armatimonadetes bacterium DC]
MIFSFLGALFITRIVGAGNYGLFSAASGIFSFFLSVGLMGTNVYLIRSSKDAPMNLFHLAFWWLLGFGTFLATALSATLVFAGNHWFRTEGFVPVALALCANIPLTLISYVPLALLERQLDYRKTTTVEVVAQTLQYIVSIPLVWQGYGVWALVAGFWASQLALPIGFFWAARYRPRWYWNMGELRAMLEYSFSQAVSGWVYNLRNLSTSMIVLPFAGQEAVGYIALAQKFLNFVSFLKGPAGRLSIPAFARLQQDAARLTRAVSEAMQLQTLALLPFLAGFAAIAPFVLPHLLGAKWDVPTLLMVFSISGIRILLSALFAIQGSALFVIKKNWLMLKANIAYIVVFFPLTYVGMLVAPPEYRLFVFNIADLVAHFPTYWYKHYGVSRYLGRVDYRITSLWTLGGIAALLAPWLGWWLYGITLVLIGHPASVREIREVIRSILAQRARRSLLSQKSSADSERQPLKEEF